MAITSIINLFVIFIICSSVDFHVHTHSISSTESSNRIEHERESNLTCNSEQLSISIEQKLEGELTSPEQNEDCGGCVRGRANLTKEEMRALRCEFVKQQILQKLHMTKRPCPLEKPPESLRVILQETEMMTDIEEGVAEDTPAEMDGKAKSVLLYPLSENPPCVNSGNLPCSRLQFELPSDMALTTPSSATVWVYKKNVGNRLKLSELVYNSDTESITVNDLVTETGNTLSRLIKFQLPSRASWLLSGDKNQILDVQITCYSGCNQDSTSAITELSDEEKPVLVVNFHIISSTPRSRRSVDCTENSVHCCREFLYINFTELGWNDWIYAPTGFEANFCKGKCQHEVNNMRSHHSTVLHTYMVNFPERAEEIGLKMCCSPSKMSDVSLLYIDYKEDETGSKNITIVKTTLKNMKVESCDCA